MSSFLTNKVTLFPNKPDEQATKKEKQSYKGIKILSIVHPYLSTTLSLPALFFLAMSSSGGNIPLGYKFLLVGILTITLSPSWGYLVAMLLHRSKKYSVSHALFSAMLVAVLLYIATLAYLFYKA